MDIDKYNKADELQRDIAWYESRVKRINEVLGGNYDRVSGLVKNLVGGNSLSRLNDAVDAEVKAYRDRLEREIEQLKKEFEKL